MSHLLGRPSLPNPETSIPSSHLPRPGKHYYRRSFRPLPYLPTTAGTRPGQTIATSFLSTSDPVVQLQPLWTAWSPPGFIRLELSSSNCLPYLVDRASLALQRVFTFPAISDTNLLLLSPTFLRHRRPTVIDAPDLPFRLDPHFPLDFRPLDALFALSTSQVRPYTRG